MINMGNIHTDVSFMINMGSIHTDVTSMINMVSIHTDCNVHDKHELVFTPM